MPQYIRHKQRGTTYKVIGEGFLQTSVPLNDYDRVTVYQAVDAPYDEEVVVRRQAEMDDGRFEDLGFRFSPEFWINVSILIIGIMILFAMVLD